MTEVYDMFFEQELSDKLNQELESVGICVSEDLIARTLAAVQAARAKEDSVTPDAEFADVNEENINKLIELAGSRKRKIRGAGQVVFRVATVMAACFVLVVGGFALRFSTMRMGKESAAEAPMAMDMNGSARKADAATEAVTDGDTAMGNYQYFSETTEADDMKIAEVEAESDMGDTSHVHTPGTPASDNTCVDDVDAAPAEAVQEEVMAESLKVLVTVDLLTESLSEADSASLHMDEQGIRFYQFIVPDGAVTPGFYRIYEDGAVEFAKIPPEGETAFMEPVEGSGDKEFRRDLLVWMKQHGYSF